VRAADAGSRFVVRCCALTSLISVPQVESSLAVQSLKPRIDLIKKRFGEDKDKVSKETNLLYEQVRRATRARGGQGQGVQADQFAV
jgi:membrane protein insertase Oxa1/YidC/SpoIIIJ